MKQEKIIQTIKKVLELSKNNPSEEEAKSAALKAQELLAKYHIDIAEVEGEEDVEQITEIRVDLPPKKWKYTLARIVSDNFRCKHFYYGKSCVVFYGHETDAEVAAETFKYLFDLGNRLAGREVDRVFAETGTSAGVYNSFVKGFCDGVKEVLEAQCTALMIVVPKDVNESYEELAKTFRRMNTSSVRTTDRDVYLNGKTEGKNAIGKRQIEG